MMRRPPKFVQGFIDRNGHTRFYFRRVGFKRAALPGLPWSPQFMEAYQAAMTGQPPKVMTTIIAPRAKQGSFAALATSYFATTTYLALKPTTKAIYNAAIGRLCASKDKNGTPIGTLGAATLRREHVQALMATRAEKPDRANLLRRVIRALMQHAIEIGLRDDDPTRDVKAIKRKGDGYHSWSDAEIAQFEACNKIGTRSRLALALLLYTGQRRSDVVTMGRQHIDKNGAIHVKQFKTGVALTIPIHPSLMAIIEATPSEHLTFLTTIFDKPFTATGFGNWFRKLCNDAGLPHCSAHGLRKAAARLLAEAGCTAHEIAAITGHASLREVQRYTKAADQTRLAAAAMDKMRTPTVNPEPLVDKTRRKLRSIQWSKR
jgi:integrase